MEETLIYLDEVVNQYLSQYRLPDSAYGRIAQLAIRGRKELHLHSCGKPITVSLEVQADKTVPVPVDSLNLLSVGYRNSDGKFIELEDNDDLSIHDAYYHDLDSGCIKLNAEFSESELEVTYLPQATQDGDYIVHPLFVEPLINWVIWQDSRGDRKTGAGDKRENERLFYNSLRIARRSAKPFNLDQVYKQYARVSTNNLSVFKWS